MKCDFYNTVSVWLSVSVSISRVVGREFALRPGHTKKHHRNYTNGIPIWHAGIGVGLWRHNLTVVTAE